MQRHMQSIQNMRLWMTFVNKTGKGGNHGAGDPQDGREGRNQAVRKDGYGVYKHSACDRQHSPFLRGPVPGLPVHHLLPEFTQTHVH